MSREPIQDKMVVVVVVDMQDGMWQSAPPDPGAAPDDITRSELFQKIAKASEGRRQTGMEALAADLQPFVDEMRGNGAKIVWAMMDSDEEVQYGGLYRLQAHPEDTTIHKSTQSAYVTNVEFFESLREEAEALGLPLEIKVCGVWANECVINTQVTLHDNGYHSRIVGDLTIDSGKPSQDSDRPNTHEAGALHTAGLRTGLGRDVQQWSDDLVKAQKQIAALRRALATGPGPGGVQGGGPDEPGF